MWPKREVARSPSLVGWPFDSRIPTVDKRVCRFDRADVKCDGEVEETWESSRFAQSITMRMLMMVSERQRSQEVLSVPIDIAIHVCKELCKLK